MSRVVVVNDWWWPDLVGGAERTAREVAVELAAHGHDVHVLVPGMRGRYADGSIRVHSVPMPLVRQTPRAAVTTRALDLGVSILVPRLRVDPIVEAAVSLTPDAVVLHNTSRLGVAPISRLRRALPRIPLVHVHHDFSATCWRRSAYRSGGICARPCTACALKVRSETKTHEGVTACLFVSDALRTYTVGAGVVPNHLTATGYPMVVGGLPLPPIRRRRPGMALQVGFIGRIAEGKGVRPLVEAIGILRRQGCDAELTVAGTGPVRHVSELQERARELGVPLRLLGEATPDRFVEFVDIVVVPSIAPEAFGRVPVEMALRGIPTLVAPVGGLPEASALVPGRSLVLDGVSAPAIARGILSASTYRWGEDSKAFEGATPWGISTMLLAVLAQNGVDNSKDRA